MADIAAGVKAENQSAEAAGKNDDFTKKVAFTVSELALRTEYTTLLSIKENLQSIQDIVTRLGSEIISSDKQIVDTLKRTINSSVASIKDIISTNQDNYGKVDFGDLPCFDLAVIQKTLDVMYQDIKNQEGREQVLTVIKKQLDTIDAQLIEIGHRIDGLDAMLSASQDEISSESAAAMPAMVFSRASKTTEDVDTNVAQESEEPEEEPEEKEVEQLIFVDSEGPTPPTTVAVQTADKRVHLYLRRT